jgi:hypothetical protein
MQSNKKYAFMWIITQMVIQPVVLTIILILALSFNVFDSSRNEIWGKNAVNLIFLVLVLVIGLTGCSKDKKEEANGDNNNYKGNSKQSEDTKEVS